MKDPADESPKSRAITGLWYILAGLAVSLIGFYHMKFGGTIPYRGKTLPLEMVAGLGGIVVIMGLVHLVIALIIRVRGRQP